MPIARILHDCIHFVRFIALNFTWSDGGIEKLCSIDVACYDRDFVRLVECQVSIDENEQCSHNLGQRKCVGKICPCYWIRIEDDIQEHWRCIWEVGQLPPQLEFRLCFSTFGFFCVML